MMKTNKPQHPLAHIVNRILTHAFLPSVVEVVEVLRDGVESFNLVSKEGWMFPWTKFTAKKSKANKSLKDIFFVLTSPQVSGYLFSASFFN